MSVHMLHTLSFLFILIYFVFATPGPVMNKFTIALREITTYKELLRSQVIIICKLEAIVLIHIAILTVLDTAS